MDNIVFTSTDDSSNESILVVNRKRRRSHIISSSSTENSDNYENDENISEPDLESDDQDEVWQPITDKRNVVHSHGPTNEELLARNIDCDDPFSIYKIFLSDNVLEIIVGETNRYARQFETVNGNSSSSNTRKHKKFWSPVSTEEIKKFIGILLIMGVVQVPEIRLYWSNNPMYRNALIKNIMTRDRFLSILKVLHFSDNSTAVTHDRLNKIRNIIQVLVDSFKNAVKPGKNIVIDESMVAWRGRLSFRQYIPGKRHKYGIKLYKLCLPGGYTYNVDIYSGQNNNFTTKGHSHDVVMNLMKDLLFQDHILYTDSYYTSLPLAEELLQKKTYLCGTVKVTRKLLPIEAKQKQKRGEIFSVESRSGVKFLKWTDKRPVCILTTCINHTCNIIEGNNGKLKPDAVWDYNIAKKGVDLSDQMSSYYTSLRKTIKWYRKVVIELICGTAIVNAWYINQKWGSKKISILKCREIIIDRLLNEMARGEEQTPKRCTTHFLQKYIGTTRKTRKRCRECYKSISAQKGRTIATKKAKRVTTFCGFCDGRPPLCLKCFQKTHKTK